ncbi:universal stress protein [Flagellimonas eckloniae]|uniref:UspA domain-containing protein n=1 Tax=Flagellimonas eckloniae TaxID=346185 RepID=A0A0Q1DJW0_9FLAO|nr:universal stress protein [Allomuricauda eckloniae]KQC29100.1 hypothetical protein AAY42_03720 [Allomuricauda eckloniae]
MKTKNNPSKYRLSVLMDLSNTSEAVLTNAVQLAKIINGTVEVFFVKTPVDVVKYDNQLSAMRAINEDRRDSKAKVTKIAEEVSESESYPISVQMTYGNIKNKLKEYVADAKPDILVLSKKKSRFIKSINDKVNVLIMDEGHNFHSFEDISLGVFDDLKGSDFEIINDLKGQSSAPVRIFSIKDSQMEHKEKTDLENTVSYVFSEGAHALDAIASYVDRTNTKLLCIPKTSKGELSFQSGNAKQVIRKLNVPVLIMS